jgi:hypothetical protein
MKWETRKSLIKLKHFKAVFSLKSGVEGFLCMSVPKTDALPLGYTPYVAKGERRSSEDI